MSGEQIQEVLEFAASSLDAPPPALSAPLVQSVRVLFDHNIPKGIAFSLKEHDVTIAVELGWESISNGKLLAQAEAAEFDVMLTADKNIRYQQNLKKRRIAIVLLTNPTWRDVMPYVDRVVAGINAATPGSYAEVEIPLPPKPRFVRS